MILPMVRNPLLTILPMMRSPLLTILPMVRNPLLMIPPMMRSLPLRTPAMIAWMTSPMVLTLTSVFNRTGGCATSGAATPFRCLRLP